MKRFLELVFIGMILFLSLYFGRNWLAAYFQNKGVIYYHKGNYLESIKLFKSSLFLNPKIPVTHYNLGNSYVGFKKEFSALAEFRKALLLDNKNILAFMAMIKLMAEKQMYESVLKEIALADPELLKAQRVNELIKKTYLSYTIRNLDNAQSALAAADMNSALSFAKKAILLKPDFAASYYILGYLYYCDKKNDAAIVCLEKTLELDPEFWAAYKLIGDIKFSAGEYVKAIIYYKRAFLLNSANAVLCNDLGLALMQIENYPEAIIYLNKALKINPGNANIRYSLASVYRDNLMLMEALTEYKILNDSESCYPNLHNDMGDIYTMMGNKMAAIAEFEKEINCANKLINKESRNLSAKNNLANAYAGLENYVNAEKIISEVIRESANYRQAYLTLARIQEKQGEFNKAVVTLEKAKKLSKENNFIERQRLRLKNHISTSAVLNIPKDKIYLKNGRILEGKVVEETNDTMSLEIFFGTSQGSIVLRKNEIKSIKRAD